MIHTLAKTSFASIGFFSLSLVGVFAQGNTFQGINNSLSFLGSFVNNATGIVVAGAFLFLFWNIAKFIWLSGGDSEKKEGAKKSIIWSVVGIFVLVSIWGIIGFIGNVLGIGSSGFDENVNNIVPVNLIGR